MLQAQVLNLQEINREIRERHDSVMAQVTYSHPPGHAASRGAQPAGYQQGDQGEARLCHGTGNNVPYLTYLRDSVMRFFASVFFHKSSSPKPLKMA
jgi:hypothetical protein